HRVPVAITPIDGYARATLAQLGIEKRKQLAHLPVDGTDAAKMVIMFGDCEHALMRDIASTQHIFKKRNDVGGLFGSAECNQKERVVCGHSAALANTWHLTPAFYAGAGRSPSARPGTRRPPSGRITCCV